MVHICFKLRNCSLAIHRAGHERSLQAQLIPCHTADVVEEVLGGIGKGGKNQHFSITFVNRGSHLFTDNTNEFIQFEIVLRRNIFHHEYQKLEILNILVNIALPRDVIHIPQVNLDFLSYAEEICVLIIIVKIIRYSREIAHLIKVSRAVHHELFDSLRSVIQIVINAAHGQKKRMNRTFHAL